MSEEKSKLDSLFDFVDKVVEKVERGASHVHYEGKEYPEEQPSRGVVVTPQQLLIGPLTYGGVAPIFHLYTSSMSKALCGRDERPQIWMRPNRSARESLVVCFGCLSNLLSVPSQQRMLGDGG